MMRSPRCLALLLLIHTARAASIEALPIENAAPYGATEDARVVVGGISHPGTAFIWNLAGGVHDPGYLGHPFIGPNHTTEATDVSADGRVVIGTSTSYDQTRDSARAFIWTEKRGMRPLGGTKSLHFDSYARSISADGKWVVGNIISLKGKGQQMVIWKNGRLSKRFPTGSSGGTISTDGRWVVGVDRGGLFRWSKKTGVQDLDLLGSDFNYPWAVSDDGGVIVGQGADATPFRWTVEGGIESLGVLQKEDSGYATDVSADGKVIVGSYSSVGAFIWTQEDGLRDLKSVLETDFGLDLTGWSLGGARWISGDATIIVGHGFLNGTARAWIARLQ